MPDDIDGGRAEHVVVGVRQRLRRRDDDGVASMNSKRIKVLHIAYGDAIVLGISHHFVLDLLPTLHAALDEDLRACCQCLVA